MNRLRRSLLFMPGDSLPKIRKATTLAVDCIVMDLEDGVALSQKVAARQVVVEALQSFDFGARERFVRLNEIEREHFLPDLEATIGARPDGYVLPKVSDVDQLRQLSDLLDWAEARRNWPTGVITILAVIESALGIMNLREIAQATPRLRALLFGAEDLASDLGAMRTPQGVEVAYARSAVVMAAAAYRLQAIDMVFFDLNDLAGLAAECEVARQLGYVGKMAIHPKQLPIINHAFAPTAAEIEQAQRLMDAYHARLAAGIGAFEFEGRLVDGPVVRAAETVLARARQAGLIE
ncbi:MAG: CoA ester lyase [Caldilineaceae bacterium]